MRARDLNKYFLYRKFFSDSYRIVYLYYYIGLWKCKDTNEIVIREMRKWTADFNIPHAAVKKLLQILNENCSDMLTLPADPRTLLKTPTHTTIQKFDNDNAYWHNGIEKCLRNCFGLLEKDLSISININVDGIPLFNSSTKCFWPILFNIYEHPSIRPMAAGIYFGDKKPENAESYMQPFVNELNEIIQSGGLIINGFSLAVKIRCIICDSPARAFLKGNIIAARRNTNNALNRKYIMVYIVYF